MKNNKGFTLLELMIVMVIIGMLAAIVIPQFSQYREVQKKSRDSYELLVRIGQVSIPYEQWTESLGSGILNNIDKFNSYLQQQFNANKKKRLAKKNLNSDTKVSSKAKSSEPVFEDGPVEFPEW